MIAAIASSEVSAVRYAFSRNEKFAGLRCSLVVNSEIEGSRTSPV